MRVGVPSWRALRIEPLDTLFFRDARPFGAADQASSGLPRPQTVAGALRTLLLRRSGVPLDRLASFVRDGVSFAEAVARTAGNPSAAGIGHVRFRGPWFVRNDEPVFPLPATLAVNEDSGALRRRDPLAGGLPGWRPPGKQASMLPLWIQGRGPFRSASERGEWLTLAGMCDFLRGGVPEPDALVRSDQLFGYDRRTGIGIDSSTRTTAEGRIYAARMLVLKPDVHLRMDVAGPDAAIELFHEDAVVPLGGEGRRAVVKLDPSAAELPCGGAGRTGDGRLAVLTTQLPRGGFAARSLSPIAAAVPSHEPVSGWDLARGGPKPNRFARAAGSVFFFPPETALPPAGSLAAPGDAALGWGAFLEGVWTQCAIPPTSSSSTV